MMNRTSGPGFVILALVLVATLGGPTRADAGAGAKKGAHGAAAAGPHTKEHGVNARQSHQQERVEQGVKSGTLGKAELARITAHQKRIAELEKRLRVNGLSTAERSQLQAELNRESQEIHRLKHDPPPAADGARKASPSVGATHHRGDSRK